MNCSVCADSPVEPTSSLCARHSRDCCNCVFMEANGNYHQRNGQLREALSCYEGALDMLPKFIPARFQMVLLFLRNGLYDKALLCLDEWLKISPKDNTALVAKGIALFWLQKYHAAIENFNSAHGFVDSYDPLDQKVVCHAYALIAVGKLHEALSLCNEVPKNYSFYNDIKKLKKQCRHQLGLGPAWTTLARHIGARVVSENPSILHDLTTTFVSPCQFLLPRHPA